MYSLGDDGNWGLQQKLLPTNSDSTANKFGNSVATSGNIIVVGADLDDSQGADSGTCFGIVFSTSEQSHDVLGYQAQLMSTHYQEVFGI